MSGKRVSVIQGKAPVLLVAPHGARCDDLHTDLLAEYAATALRGFAVINRGWERSASVDYLRDRADCNNFTHMADVVRDEFLDPILRFRNRILKAHATMFLFFMHGMSNEIRAKTGEPRLDAIVGYGAGSPPSYTCETWRKDLFVYLLGQIGLTVWQGKSGGAMSGWTRNNMNQLFRRHYPDRRVQSIQVEVVRELRKDQVAAEMTAEHLAAAMEDLSRYQTWTPPANLHIGEY
jgi:hypothetical protein